MNPHKLQLIGITVFLSGMLETLKYGIMEIGAGKDRFSPGSLLNSKTTFCRAISPLA